MDNQEQQTMKVMAVEQCKATGKLYSSPADFKGAISNSYYNYREPSMMSIANHALSALETARAADIATHEKNGPALVMNAAIHAHITEFMKAVKMPDGWTERDPSSRARVPRRITHIAGWRTDLAKHCAISDGFDAATKTYESLKGKYTEYMAAALRENEQKAAQTETEAAKKLAQRLADKDLVGIITRYELPIEAEWDDVLEALRKRDQRLDLAVAMYRVRSDWNEGCGAVESALGRFTVRDNEDKDIANDVLGCTHDFEDGRVFRDTTWSYDRLFASVVDKQLTADVQMAMRHTEE